MPAATHRPSGLQRLQAGIETTAGVKAAANRAFNSLSISPVPNLTANGDNYRPMGSKVTNAYTIMTEHSESDVSGAPDYNEIVYPLSSAVGNRTSAQLTDNSSGTPTPVAGAFLHKFKVDNDNADSFDTFTLEYGDSRGVARVLGAVLTAFGIQFQQDQAQLSGSMYGGKYTTDGVAFTPTPSREDPVPMLPADVCVYLSTDPTTLGTDATRLRAAFNSQFNIGNRWQSVWPLRCDLNGGYDGYVETQPDITQALQIENDQYAMDLLNRLRQSETQFIRIEAKARGLAIPYRFTMDMAGQLSDNPSFGDQNSVYTVTYNFGAVNDPDFGILSVEVVNALETL